MGQFRTSYQPLLYKGNIFISLSVDSILHYLYKICPQWQRYRVIFCYNFFGDSIWSIRYYKILMTFSIFWCMLEK